MNNLFQAELQGLKSIDPVVLKQQITFRAERCCVLNTAGTGDASNINVCFFVNEIILLFSEDWMVSIV